MKFNPRKLADMVTFLECQMGEVSTSVTQNSIQIAMPHGIFLYLTEMGLRSNVETVKGRYHTTVDDAFKVIQDHLQNKVAALTALPCMRGQSDPKKCPCGCNMPTEDPLK